MDNELAKIIRGSGYLTTHTLCELLTHIKIAVHRFLLKNGGMHNGYYTYARVKLEPCIPSPQAKLLLPVKTNTIADLERMGDELGELLQKMIDWDALPFVPYIEVTPIAGDHGCYDIEVSTKISVD